MEQRKRYSLTQAAFMTGISRWTLRDWVYKKRIPFTVSPGGHIYLSSQWVDEQIFLGKPVFKHIKILDD